MALYPPCDRATLKNIEWEEGKVIPLVVGTYWYQLVIMCSSMGKQKALFANGEYPFFEFARSVNDAVLYATNIVPVLPDGRFLMVIEQRGPHSLYPERPRTVRRPGGRNIDLGLYGSLEFPGGAIDSTDQSVSSGALRELVEETGIRDQEIHIFSKRMPVIAHGAGVALGMKLVVAYLSAPNQKSWVFEDGVKMPIFALTEGDIERGILHGSINSGQAAHLGWQFFKQVEQLKIDYRGDADFVTGEEFFASYGIDYLRTKIK